MTLEFTHDDASVTDGTYTATLDGILTPFEPNYGYFVSEFGGESFDVTDWEDGFIDAGMIRSRIARRAIDSNSYVGIWTTHDGRARTYVDVTRWFPNRTYAVEYGFRNAQLAIWDVDNGVEIPVTRPAVAIGPVTLSERVDGIRGHVVTCTTHGPVCHGVTREPARKALARHLTDTHGIDVDVWTPAGEYVESATGDVLTAGRDTVGNPNSFGFTWTRFDQSGQELQTGTAGTESAARVLARMSNR